MNHYHYIFTGNGLSALLTLFEMIQSGQFSDKKILLIDSDSKNKNDRTWCFWDTENLFDEILSIRTDAVKDSALVSKINISDFAPK